MWGTLWIALLSALLVIAVVKTIAAMYRLTQNNGDDEIDLEDTWW